MPSFDFPPPDSLINTIPEAGGVLSCIHRPEQDISMSNTWKSSLKDRLLELPCHFTWNLFDEDLDVESVEEKLHDQLGYLSIACKHRLYSFMAYLKHLQGDNDEAILQLQKAEAHLQKYGPSDADLKKLAIYSNYAWVYLHDNQYSKSLAYAEKAKTIIKEYESPPMKNSLLLEIYSERGWVYVSYPGKYFIKAVEYFEKAMELDPNNPELNSGFAIAVYREEQFNPPQDLIDKSFPLLERAIELNPNDVVLLAIIALKHHQLKNYDKAEMLINQVLQKDPESPYILRYIAMYYNRRGFMNEAIAVVKKALNLTPTSSSLHFLLGNFYLKWSNQKKKEMGRARDQSWYYYKPQIAETISNAIFHFEKAVELKKTFVMAYIVLGEAYIKANKFQKAEEAFHKSLSMRHISCPERQELHLKWGLYELNVKGCEYEAVRHFKEAIMMRNPTISRAYAVTDLRELAKKKIRQNSSDATGYGLLGFIHQQEGQDQAAQENYQKALQLDPSNQEYIEALSTCCNPHM